MTKLRIYARAFATALSIFRYSSYANFKYGNDDRMATQQFLKSESGQSFLRLLLAFCSLRDAKAVLAGGDKFEAGKAVGCREMVAYLAFLGGSAAEEDSESAEEGDLAELGHLGP